MRFKNVWITLNSSVHATPMCGRQKATSASHRAILGGARNQLFFAANQTKLTQLMAIHVSQLLPSSFTTISCAFTHASTMGAADLLATYMPFYFWLYCTQNASTTGVHTPPTTSRTTQLDTATTYNQLLYGTLIWQYAPPCHTWPSTCPCTRPGVPPRHPGGASSNPSAWSTSNLAPPPTDPGELPSAGGRSAASSCRAWP
jgi:hypothetical protein